MSGLLACPTTTRLKSYMYELPQELLADVLQWLKERGIRTAVVAQKERLFPGYKPEPLMPGLTVYAGPKWMPPPTFT